VFLSLSVVRENLFIDGEASEKLTGVASQRQERKMRERKMRDDTWRWWQRRLRPRVSSDRAMERRGPECPSARPCLIRSSETTGTSAERPHAIWHLSAP